MRVLILVSFLLFACTKRNPEACCVDEADCTNVGLPVGTTCDDGFLCRGNRCVEERCDSSAQCDVSAPYCVVTDEGRCAETCSDDTQCPGFSQVGTDKFCVDGSCAACRVGMNDCPASAPLCSNGQCVTCVAHADCGSGVCANGTCAREDEIAFVTTNGSPSSDCTSSSPCNGITRALAVSPPRPYVVVDAGTYSSASTIAVTGTRWIIGRGAARPVLTRSTDGPIVQMSGPADAKIEYIEVFNARGMASPNEGIGIQCRVPGFAPRLALVDVVIRMSQSAAVEGGACAFTATRTSFVDNVGSGVSLTDGTANIDRCTSMGNMSTGLALDGGIYVVTNSLIARNAYRGVDIYSTNNGNRVEFNTIVDNGTPTFGTGFYCNLQGAGAGIFDSNIIARNATTQTEPPVTPCTHTNSIIIDTDITPLKFKRPDVAPFDYHIQSGSTAIDAGSTTTTLKVDIDGDARPNGASSDLGADELH